MEPSAEVLDQVPVLPARCKGMLQLLPQYATLPNTMGSLDVYLFFARWDLMFAVEGKKASLTSYRSFMMPDIVNNLVQTFSQYARVADIRSVPLPLPSAAPSSPSPSPRSLIAGLEPQPSDWSKNRFTCCSFTKHGHAGAMEACHMIQGVSVDAHFFYA